MKKTPIISLLLLCLFVLIACQSTPEPAAEESVESTATLESIPLTDTPEPEPTSTADPEPTATIEPEPTNSPEPEPTNIPESVTERTIAAEAIVIIGADGLEIQGTVHADPADEQRPAVLLLHMLGGNQHAWDEFVPHLTDAGYVVVTIDLRGHGATGGSRNWVLAEEDLIVVWRTMATLPTVDASKTALIGGSIGSNMALITADNLPTIRTAVLLSPGLDYRGVTTTEPATSYGDRPLLIVASEEDSYSADSSRDLAEIATNATLEIYDGAGHGTNMLDREPALTPLLLSWLDEHVK